MSKQINLTPFIEEGTPLGTMVRHPLYVGPLYDDKAARAVGMTTVAEAIAAKRDQANKAIAKREFARYVWMHERPFRLDAYLDVYDEFASQERDQLLGQLWVDTEFPSRYLNKWNDLFMDAHREYVMGQQDLRTFQKLGNEITIFRGADSPRGLSWTLSIEKAKWFACRWKDAGDVGTLWSTRIKTSLAYALFNARVEQEIVVSPYVLTNVTQQEVK